MALDADWLGDVLLAGLSDGLALALPEADGGELGEADGDCSLFGEGLADGLAEGLFEGDGD